MATQLLQFVKGINKDVHPRLLDDQTYFDALNAINMDSEGDFYAIGNEKGNELCIDLGTKRVIGSINTDTEEIVLFSTDNFSSEIGLFDPTCCKYKTVLNTTCLNFKTCNPIKGVFKVRKGCERHIYFTDKTNPIKVINLDNLDQYTVDGNVDCSLMSLSAPYQYPGINVEALSSGGTIEVGAYQVSVRYLDEDNNSTDWSIPGPPIYVTDDSVVNNWNGIDGALNIAFYTAEQGGVPRTSKSLNITLSDLDDRYASVEVAIIKSVAGLGTFTTIERLTSRAILSNSVTITYTGQASQILEELSLQNISVDRDDISIVGNIVQLDHSLWLGNIKTAPYDYAAFQREALNITLTPKVKRINHRNPLGEGNPKNPKPNSYMGGEVQSFGIIYHFKNGNTSPAFHIPGRAAIDNERTIIGAWTPEMAHITSEDNFNTNYAKNNADLIANPSKPVVRTYELYDTAQRTGTTEVTFGYYENKGATYPVTTDCEGEAVWGDLAGTPIRHHKFPSRRTIPIVENENGTTWLNLLGFEVSNITYPHPDIVGHTIVRGERTPDNKTILDKGILDGVLQVGDNSTYDWVSSNPTSFSPVVLSSPKTFVDETLQGGNHFFIEGMYDDDFYFQTNNFSTPGAFNPSTEVETSTNQNYFQDMGDLPVRSNYGFDSAIIVDRGSTQTQVGNFEGSLTNKSLVEKIAFYHIQEDAQENISYLNKLFVSIKNTLDVFSNLSAITYLPVMSSPQYGTTTHTIYTGSDTVVTPLDHGDIFTQQGGGILSAAKFNAINQLGFWIETEYNWAMRHEGTTACTSIYDGVSNPNFYWIEKIADNNGSGDWILKNEGDICRNFNKINKDFTKQAVEKPSFTLSANYDYCSKCLNHYPNRIYFSQRDDLESDGDNYRNILVNNYRNLDTGGDSITAMFTDKNELYALTTSYAYFIPTRAQQIQTDENIAYIGTGDRLSIPPTKLVSTDFKYGGTTEEYSIVNTQFGTIYVDDASGKIYKLSSQLEEISNLGLSQFFEDNLPSTFKKLYSCYTEEEYFCKASTINNMGVGLRATYDPRFRRYILHKKDYELQAPYNKILPTSAGSRDFTAIYVDHDLEQFYIIGRFGSFIPIVFGDPKYFKDISWTASYSLDRNAWISFHSYSPQWMFNNHNEFYSTQGGKVYTHNKGEHTKYYGVKYPFFIETIFNDKGIINKTLDNIEVVNDSYENNEYVDQSFTDYWVYNNKQSTGVVTLVPYSSNTYYNIDHNTQSEIREIKDKYRFNIIRNRLNSLPSYVTDIEHRVPVNISNTDFYNQARIKGDYSHIRLILNTELDYRLITHSVLAHYSESNR